MQVVVIYMLISIIHVNLLKLSVMVRFFAVKRQCPLMYVALLSNLKNPDLYNP